MSKPVIGFIGLGLMGGNMVENLQKRGFEVIVMDLNQEAVDRVLARGNATQASSPKELAEKSDIVQFCLTTSAVVEKIVYGEMELWKVSKKALSLSISVHLFLRPQRKLVLTLPPKGLV